MRAQGFVSSGERAPEEMVAAVADSVVSGLAATHARKQLHRDVKPGNVSALSFLLQIYVCILRTLFLVTISLFTYLH